MTLPPLLRLCRMHQYTKNLFIFAPIFFAAHFGDLPTLLRVTAAFICFCLLASAIYIFNDYRDIQEDRLHPTKKNRPLAAGSVTQKKALILGLFLLMSSLTLAASLVPSTLPLLALYAGLNMAYSLYIKRFSLLDITVIAMGFVIRLYVGGVTAELPLSRWIVIITFLLALFLALAKRRDDVVRLSNGEATRAAIQGYNEVFLSTAMAVVAAIVNVAYLMYTVSDVVVARVGTDQLFFTSAFVLLGFLRYLQLTFVEGKSGSPSVIVLTDGFLQAVITLWLLGFAIIIY